MYEYIAIGALQTHQGLGYFQAALYPITLYMVFGVLGSSKNKKKKILLFTIYKCVFILLHSE